MDLENTNTEVISTATLPETPDNFDEVFGDTEDVEVSLGEESPASPEGAVTHAAPDGDTGAPSAVVPPGTAAAAPTPPEVPGAVAPTPQAAVPPPAPTIVPGAVAAPEVAPAPATGQTPPAQDLVAMRENLVSEIAQRYSMPDAVKDEFMMSPEKVLPTFAARLYVDVYEAVLSTVMSQIPQVMGAREQQLQVQRKVESTFFERWPGLQDPTYQRDIASVAKTYRQQNPQATLQQTVEAVGAMVSVMKGVPLPGQPAPGATPPTVRPPVPAGVGASRAPVPSTPQQNLFAEIFASRDE